jgi:nucleoside-diphosphate-sugar epimerase
VQANLLACEAPSASGKVYNIGTGSSISLNQTLELLGAISGKKLQARYDLPRDGDIRDSLAEIQRAKEELGYEPTVLFAEGLRRTFEWYQSNQGESSRQREQLRTKPV